MFIYHDQAYFIPGIQENVKQLKKKKRYHMKNKKKKKKSHSHLNRYNSNHHHHPLGGNQCLYLTKDLNEQELKNHASTSQRLHVTYGKL